MVVRLSKTDDEIFTTLYMKCVVCMLSGLSVLFQKLKLFLS